MLNPKKIVASVPHLKRKEKPLRTEHLPGWLKGKPLWIYLDNFQGKDSKTKSFIPAINSGPLPECAPIPWDSVDPCHKHVCKKSIHLVTSTCTTMGVTCGEGEYLKISPMAKSKSDCCKCAKFER